MEQLGFLDGWMESPSSLVLLAIGVGLLFAGRKLFWLLVAAAGFLAGVLLADAYFSFDSDAARLSVGLLAGGMAAGLAFFLKRIAIGAAGAVLAGYGVYSQLSLGGQAPEGWHWLLILGAGLIGLMISELLVDFGLIFLSAVAGATLILEAASPEDVAARWLFLGLVIVGSAVQAASMRKKE